ncbi:dihydrolipoamide dehydrogenase [Stella humosa]|uniref:Dihydrolipoyl dehydrogenase n=1 Tax=Stella humosa TaxID=94 RepID=A0A3N1L0Y4_9PROT|nr:dihydrolipoyl dehydrogenase [Stella humosa]ROP84640.1 dihydrolipoamide dehydrogenase [Stella humosa]BBK34160.1 dihydrolipoyl dehydrogenase [Stella humosa]
MAEESFDLVVIGGGPGGYVAAIRAAQLGMRVACVEKDATLGGTCLNVGCIPSKALLDSSEKFHEVGRLARQGVVVDKVTLDLPAMMAWKDKAVFDNTRGIDFLFKKNKVERVRGLGRIAAAGRVVATAEDGSERTFATRTILIATGSEVMPLPGVAIDETRIVSSTGALSLGAVPKHLVVVGGGIIGLELGSVWRRLGAEVTVIEFLDRITPGIDLEVAKTLQRTLGKQGMKFRLGTKVTKAEAGADGITLSVEPSAGGTAETLSCDVVLVAIGRRPFTTGLGLDAVGIATDAKGRIPIDEHFQTPVPGIYAIGDVVRGPMLAHKAEDEGSVVAEIIAGQSGHIDYNAIPGVVYTWPEVATVGRNEEELKADGVAYKVGKFPFTANGRARCVGDTDGFVKILADARTEKVLGVHIIGPDAGTLIAECVLAMEYGGSAEDIARTCHAHPTLNEAVKEAALAVDGRALHI